jgi:hypothetical protein
MAAADSHSGEALVAEPRDAVTPKNGAALLDAAAPPGVPLPLAAPELDVAAQSAVAGSPPVPALWGEMELMVAVEPSAVAPAAPDYRRRCDLGSPVRPRWSTSDRGQRLRHPLHQHPRDLEAPRLPHAPAACHGPQARGPRALHRVGEDPLTPAAPRPASRRRSAAIPHRCCDRRCRRALHRDHRVAPRGQSPDRPTCSSATPSRRQRCPALSPAPNPIRV